jgi:hypothetical protein
MLASKDQLFELPASSPARAGVQNVHYIQSLFPPSFLAHLDELRATLGSEDFSNLMVAKRRFFRDEALATELLAHVRAGCGCGGGSGGGSSGGGGGGEGEGGSTGEREVTAAAAAAAAVGAGVGAGAPAAELHGTDIAALSHVNCEMRFLEYSGGGFIKPHRDGVAVDPITLQPSTTSFLLYLSDVCEGGETEFLAGLDACGDAPLFSIAPRRGCIAIFPHNVCHQGTAVSSAFPKVVLRGEMY